MRVAVVDAANEVLWRGRRSSQSLDQQQLLDALAEEISLGIDEHPEVAAVGLGIPCTIDQHRGLAISAVNLPIHDLPIRDEMGDRLGLPVVIDNDANAAAYGEFVAGAGRDSRHLVMATVGTGIGGGVVVDGRVQRGSYGAGGELGHTVIEVDGPPCQGTCPNRGCVEVMASGTALAEEGLRLAKGSPDSALGRHLADGRAITGRVVVEAAVAGDEPAKRLMARIGRRLGTAMASWANIFDPDVIVLGGGVVAGAGALLIDPAREELRARALPPMNQAAVTGSSLGEEAGTIGAAALAATGIAAT